MLVQSGLIISIFFSAISILTFMVTKMLKLFFILEIYLFCFLRLILLCRVFFPHDLDAAADAILSGRHESQ